MLAIRHTNDAYRGARVITAQNLIKLKFYAFDNQHSSTTLLEDKLIIVGDLKGG